MLDDIGDVVLRTTIGSDAGGAGLHVMESSELLVYAGAIAGACASPFRTDRSGFAFGDAL